MGELNKKPYLDELPSRRQTKIVYDRCRPQYEAAAAKISRKIRRLLHRRKLNVLIRLRVKTFDSFFGKIIRLYNEGRREGLVISDLIGIRIICPFLGDIETVKNLLQQHFIVLEIEHKGAAHSFREFGYESLHLLLKLPDGWITESIPFVQDTCEVQIRTKLQDAWAEVEHELIYKADYSLLNEPIKRKLAMLNAGLSLADTIFQEIRDYQRVRQTKEEKRRAAILSAMEAMHKANPFREENHANGNSGAPVFLPVNSLDRLLFQALDAHARQDYHRAFSLYSQIIEKCQDRKICSVIYNHRGAIHLAQQQYGQAINDFTRAIQFNPQNFRAYNNRGLCYRMLKKYDRALEDFESSLEIEALQTDAFLGRSQVFFDLGDFCKAAEECRKALNIDPQFAPAQRFLQIIQAKMFEKQEEK